MQHVINYVITKLATIDNIENIFSAIPLARTRKQVQTYFDSEVQAWEIIDASGVEDLSSANTCVWDNILQIDGWYLYKDSTTKSQMQTFVDKIMPLFRQDLKLGGTVKKRGPLRKIFVQTDWFFDTLTHHCRFQMEVTETY